MKKEKLFHMYRFQILPKTQSELEAKQLHFDFAQPISLDELKARKNEFFIKALRSIQEFEYSRSELIHQFDAYNHTSIVKLAANRALNRETKEFELEAIENWPHLLIIINNDPNIQKIAIEHNFRVFQSTRTVSTILQDNINRHLASKNLHVFLEPLFEKNDFWQTIEKHQDDIIEADFELISPNLSNITQTLEVDLKTLHQNTNTQRTNLQLNSDKDSCLTISKDDPMVNSLVDYSSEGGGNISLKIRGVKKKVHTKNSSKSISIDELKLENASAKDINEIFKTLLK